MLPIIPYLFGEQSEFPVVTPWKTTVDHRTAASTLAGHAESRHENETTNLCDQGERQVDEDESSNDSLSTEDESKEIPIDSIIIVRAEKNEGAALELVRSEPTTTGLPTVNSDECLTYLGQEVELEDDRTRRKSKKATTAVARNSHTTPVTETQASKISIRVSRQQKIPHNVKANDSDPIGHANKSTRQRSSIFNPSTPSPRKVDAIPVGVKDATPGLSEPNESPTFEPDTLKDSEECTHMTTVTDVSSGSHSTLGILGHYFCRCNAGGAEVGSGGPSNSALGKAVHRCLVSSDSSESHDSTIISMGIFRNALEVGISPDFSALEDVNTLQDSEGFLTPEDEIYNSEAAPGATISVDVPGSREEIKRETVVARSSTVKRRLPRIKLAPFRSPFFRRNKKSASIFDDDNSFLDGLIAREVKKMALFGEIHGKEPGEYGIGTIPSGLSDLLEAIIEEKDRF